MRVERVAPVLFAIAAIAAFGPAAQAHCQIPCGIYDDEMRIAMMLEHVTTIEKSINQINTLGSAETKDWNQLVRWVDNKEQHADELADIVTYYFMTQRIKPPAADDPKATEKYARELSLLHNMLLSAMKAKQTTDLQHVKALREQIEGFKKSYLDHTHG